VTSAIVGAWSVRPWIQEDKCLSVRFQGNKLKAVDNALIIHEDHVKSLIEALKLALEPGTVEERLARLEAKVL
jgi:hypothetical protein